MRKTYTDRFYASVSYPADYARRTGHRLLLALTLLAVLLLVLAGSSIRAFANARESAPLHTYYTSIRLENGDSLWSLADDYEPDPAKRQAFIDEVCALNGISEQSTLHSGRYLVIAYSSAEQK